MKRYSLYLLAPVLALAALPWFAPNAQAFYPQGVFIAEDEYRVNFQLVHPRWTIRQMDTNRDGDIAGPNEGVPITMESGNDGFTLAEQQLIRQAAQTWQNVPTSFIAFNFTQTSSDQLESTSEGIDFFNFIDLDRDGALPAGVLGVVVSNFVLNDGIYDINGQQVQVTGPRYMDVDVIISEAPHRAANPGEEPFINLNESMTHAFGLMVGMDRSPMQNFILSTANGDDENVEERVFNTRDVFGSLVPVGVTPTMYPDLFYYSDGVNSWVDLAPDDVAGITYLYPRGDRENFFELRQEARTFSDPDFPSQPLTLAHVVAWCDVDNNAGTRRVPLFDTLTGLYQFEDHLGGKFRLMNMVKQIESVAGSPFSATYTITCAALEPPEDFPSDAFDSTHSGLLRENFDPEATGGGGGGDDTGGGGDGDTTDPDEEGDERKIAKQLIFDADILEPPYSFASQFPSQVFREGDNLFGLDKRDQGTPLRFDAVRRQIVSTTSGKALDQILPGTRPMFGDQDQTCLLNQVAGPLKNGNAPTALRKLRDSVMLNTVIGTALADLYYQLTPGMAAYVRDHHGAWIVANRMFTSVEWLFTHYRLSLLLVLAAATLGAWRIRRWRKGLVASAMLAAFLYATAPALATSLPWDTPTMAANSEAIISGKVTQVKSRWDEKRIVTDITITVDDSLKGRLNKNSSITITQLGGSIGGVISRAIGLPTFREDEEVILFMGANGNGEANVVAGERGKLVIQEVPDTGEKVVRADNALSATGLAEVRKNLQHNTAKNAEEANTDISRDLPVETYKQYLREIVYAQEREEREAAQESAAHVQE